MRRVSVIALWTGLSVACSGSGENHGGDELDDSSVITPDGDAGATDGSSNDAQTLDAQSGDGSVANDASDTGDADMGPIDCGDQVFTGNLRFQKAADFDQLAGVTRLVGQFWMTAPLTVPPLALRCVEGDFKISSIAGQPDLRGLSQLRRVTGLVRIDHNPQLANLEGLGGLREIAGDLTLEENAMLASVAGLSGLTRIEGQLRIWNNDKLNSLVGLERLAHAGKGLWFANQPLTDLRGLSGLNHVGGISLVALSGMVSLAGMTNLSGVDGALTLTDMPLTNLSGLQSIQTVAGAFEWNGGSEVTSLDGFSPRSIGGRLALANLPKLADISALAALKSLGGDLYFRNDLSLPQCRVQALYDRLVKEGYAGTLDAMGTSSACPEP